MFGQTDEDLIEGLERLRQRLCCYGGADRCDCKFGASGKGEQSGCPEIAQAVKYLIGQRDDVLVTSRMFEESAEHTLRKIRHVIADDDKRLAKETNHGG